MTEVPWKEGLHCFNFDTCESFEQCFETNLISWTSLICWTFSLVIILIYKTELKVITGQ